MAESSGIRARSPVVGLPRGRLTQVQVLAQSVSAVAPSAVMVTLPVLVMAQVGRGVIAVFVVATLLVAAVGYCIREFATRMAAVSGLYSYTVKGLGPTTGFAAGWSLLVGYGAAAMASLVGAGSYLAALLGRTGVPQGTPTVVALSAAAGVVALLLMLRGVQLSARIMLAIEVFAILAASAVLVVAFAAGGGAAALLTTMPLIVAVPVVCLLVSGSSRATLVGLLAVSAHGYIVAYVLVCVATPVFLRRIGESTRGATVVGTVTAACLVGLIVWVAVTSWGRAEGTSTAVYLAIMAAGALVHLVRIRPRPAIAQRIGVYDETTEADLLGPSPPWAVRR